MTLKESVLTDKAPAPMPFFSQAIKCNGMVYCSGSIGMDPKTNKLVEGSVGDRTVCLPSSHPLSFSYSPNPYPITFSISFHSIRPTSITASSLGRRELFSKANWHLKGPSPNNLSEVLKAAGSSIDNVVKVNVFLTKMENFAAMNKVYDGFFSVEPKPVRTCVAVFQLPLGTDVEIELTAHL